MACSFIGEKRCSVNEEMNKAAKAGVLVAPCPAAFKNEPSKTTLKAQVLSSYILVPRLNAGSFPKHLFT